MAGPTTQPDAENTRHTQPPKVRGLLDLLADRLVARGYDVRRELGEDNQAARLEVTSPKTSGSVWIGPHTGHYRFVWHEHGSSGTGFPLAQLTQLHIALVDLIDQLGPPDPPGLPIR